MYNYYNNCIVNEVLIYCEWGTAAYLSTVNEAPVDSEYSTLVQARLAEIVHICDGRQSHSPYSSVHERKL